MAISAALRGGLGNILFVTAALEYLGKRFGYKTVYPNIKEHLNFLNGDFYNYNLYPYELPKIFKNFDWHINKKIKHKIDQVRRLPFTYSHIMEVEDNTHFISYFQSEEYWGGEKDFVQQLLEPSDFVLEQLKEYMYLFDEVTCCVHVRRGDYLNHPDIYHPVGVDYIEKAIKEFECHKIKKYLVFSDDLDWCKANLKGHNFMFMSTGKDYLDMFLMSLCEQKIISNSTFSWWAAYLSPKGGEIIAPKDWIADPKIDDSHVCPWYWKKL